MTGFSLASGGHHAVSGTVRSGVDFRWPPEARVTPWPPLECGGRGWKPTPRKGLVVLAHVLGKVALCYLAETWAMKEA